MKTLPLLALFVAAGPVAAFQSPVLGPPTSLAGDLAPAEAGGVQEHPDVAAGGPGALAVWVDHRAELNSPLANQGGPDVYAIRIDAAGQPLDPVALRMPPEVGDKSFPKAAWNGSAWLVVWENQQPFGTSSFFRRLVGARVAADGSLLDVAPIVIKDDLETVGATMAVASDGAGWIVVAQGSTTSPSAIVAVRVAADGTVTNPGGTQIADVGTAIGRPDLAYASGRFLLVWSSGSVSGQRFDTSLAPLGGKIAIGSGSSGFPRVATDGQDFLVAWQNADFGSNVRARRVVGASGALASVLQVTTLSNFEYNWQPDVAWTGNLWHVVYRDTTTQDVYRVARIRPDLSLLPGGASVLPFGPAAADGRVVLAAGAGGVIAVFERTNLTQPWPGEIRSAAVSDALVATTPATVSLSAPRQSSPAIAVGPAQALVAFARELPNGISISVQRVDPFGASIDAAPTSLSVAPTFRDPAVAWNGEVYLVVWDDSAVVLGMRVAPDGTVLDPGPFPVMIGRYAAVGARGSTFLVAATDAPVGEHQRNPYAQRVATDGALVGPRVQLGGSFARYPEVAPLGDGWIVTWQRNFTHDNPNSVARAALVAADGSTSGDFLVDGAAGFGGAARPAVASQGDTALLVWQDDFQGLAGRLVQADGTLQAPFAVAPLPALPALPSVAWNGEEYAVAWQDYRAQIGLWDYRTDVYAARVDATGVVLDGGGGFPLAAGVDTELSPAVAGADGATLFAYDEYLPDAPYATLRVRLRHESPWQAAGGAAPGAPALVGQGELVPGGTVTWSLAGAPPSAFGAFVLGLSRLDVPLFGDTLVPALDQLLYVVAGTGGAASTSAVVPPAFAAGMTLWVQSWSVDAAGPQLLVGSNAIESTTP